MRNAKFRVEEHRRFNGEDTATVVVSCYAGTNGMLTVRPKGSRKVYEKSLQDVAAWVIFKCAQEEAEHTRAERKSTKALRFMGRLSP